MAPSLAAPFLPSIYEKAAKAQGTTHAAPPKRLVIFYTHNGCLTNRWFPKITTYTNGAAPLTARLGRGADAGAADPVHEQAAGAARIPVDERLRVGPVDRSARSGDGLEARPARRSMQANKRYATAASLDHVIAKQINPSAASPLVLSVGAASTEHQRGPLVLDAGRRVPADRQPGDGLQPADRRVRHRPPHDRRGRPGGSSAARASSICARPTWPATRRSR